MTPSKVSYWRVDQMIDLSQWLVSDWVGIAYIEVARRYSADMKICRDFTRLLDLRKRCLWHLRMVWERAGETPPSFLFD